MKNQFKILKDEQNVYYINCLKSKGVFTPLDVCKNIAITYNDEFKKVPIELKGIIHFMLILYVQMLRPNEEYCIQRKIADGFGAYSEEEYFMELHSQHCDCVSILKSHFQDYYKAIASSKYVVLHNGQPICLKLNTIDGNSIMHSN